jgi:cellulose synthase/poly-beta-1,6-N-acetylglucosamine synthase-like glycosyltransferase
MGAKVIRTPKNTSMKAKAINFGLKFCSPNTEIVIVVDADTVLAPNLVHRYVQAFSDAKIFLVSGYILPRETKTIWQKARLVQYLHYLGFIKEAQNYWFSPIVASRCCLGMRKEMLEKLDGFGEGHVAEDMTLTWKGLIKGL